MIIKTMTFNVRGLNEPRKIDRLRHYFQSTQGGFDVIMLQEHKLRGEKALNLGRQLVPNSSYWTLEAEAGYNTNGREGAGRGGICTILHSKLAPLVSSHGSLFRNRASWIRLSGLPGGDLGILNVYAPNDPRDRTALWQELMCRLPSDCRSLVSGDFNMTEIPTDKSSFCSKVMTQGEKLVWDAFTSHLHLSDTFSHNGKLKYSWDNKRRDGCRILGRLDRHYTSSPSGPYPSLTTRNYTIRGDCPASDHLPVTIDIVLQDTVQRRSGYKMNTSYLQHAEVKNEVTRIWSEERSEASTFYTRLRKFVRFYKSYCKRQAVTLRRKELVAREGLAAAQETLQSDPQNVAAQLQLAQRQGQLLSFKSRKAEGRQLRARLRWRMKGDSMTKEFFRAVQEKPTRSLITELRSPNGASIKQQ